MLKAPESERPVTVIVADASRMKSQLMVSALQRSRQRISVAGSALDSTEIHKLLVENCVDVAIIGSNLKEGPVAGFDAVRQVRASHPLIHIVLTLESSPPNMIVEAFRAGADGVLSRDDSFDLLCKCIRAVHEGQVWANSEQLHCIVDALTKASPSPTTTVTGEKLLTQREEGLVQLVSQGLTNREISKQLNLSEHTVRNYLFRIFNKVGTSNRLELALYSIYKHEHRAGAGSLSPDAATRAESVAGPDARHLKSEGRGHLSTDPWSQRPKPRR
jgi:two-component system nitrate/nitrite response regulator NarL